jgi:hypothetical protein
MMALKMPLLKSPVAISMKMGSGSGIFHFPIEAAARRSGALACLTD